jgi:Gram-negative bacterial TonB protein C-terminal
LKNNAASLAYRRMRVSGFLFAILLSTAGLAWSQTTDVPTEKSSESPAYRPILMGTGPDALINRIDTKDLMAKGQKEGAVMFICFVDKTGEVTKSGIYHDRDASNVQALENELRKRLSPAANPTFIPAIYNHAPVSAIYFGTVTFAVVKGKPRLRIFSNQQPEEVSKENDFIGPQPIFGAPSSFTGLHYPFDVGEAVETNGFVEMELKIDAHGNLQDMKVAREEPPLAGFGKAALSDFEGAKFIPAFRNGQPVACDVKLPFYYNERAVFN